jgi:hypothetical protein
MIRLRERHARAPGASRRDGLCPPLHPEGHAPEAPAACTRARPDTRRQFRRSGPGSKTGSKRRKSASLNQAESHHEKARKPHE